MKKVALYSNSARRAPRPAAHTVPAAPSQAAAKSAQRASVDAGPRPPEADAAPGRSAARPRWPARHPGWVAIGSAALAALAVVAYDGLAPSPRRLTQDDIDAAVLRTLETATLPSMAARAYEAVRPSLVRVRGFTSEEGGSDDTETSVGSGVVIVDKGVILTNLHVVASAKRLKVRFADGLEADARVIAVQAENDLAVLQAQKVPDDLVAATMRSTKDLAVGDHVVAAGFPFGIGPSVSAGVVSGLRREYRSPEGKKLLTNLIQFDAAVNPGSSGGPLITAGGEVVGIVTAILNPTEHGFFVGIGFAVPIENAASAAGLSPF